MAEVLATYSYSSVTIGGVSGYSVTCSNKSTCTKAEIPSTYNNKPVLEIGYQAFGQCTKLTSVTIPNSVTSIGESAFYACTGLTSITIPDSVTRIGSCAFQSCKGLSSIAIPNSVKSIVDYAFYSCTGLTSITIPDSVTNIGASAFAKCPIETAKIPAHACSEIKNSTLKTVIITSGTSIGESAFSGCISLTSITIPDSVTSIGKSSFSGCTVLSDVYFTGTTAQWQSITIGSGNTYLTSATLHIVKTLTYDTNGGTLQSGFPNPAQVADYPNPMPTVSLGSYQYGGWYSDNNTFASAITAGGALSDNITIYAKLYNTITYNLDGGTNNVLNPANYTSTDVASGKLLCAATKSGYDFEGWYSDASFANKVVSFGSFTGAPVTLYAKFTAQEAYEQTIKTSQGKKKINLDAYTVRGNSPYANINGSSLGTMGNLYAKVTEVNAKNEHAFFDLSSYITGAYVCLVDMKEVGSSHFCEIHDLLNDKVYYKSAGYQMIDTISSYIASCARKDAYENISISSLSTMGELRTFVNSVNTHGDHCFFDFSQYVTGAYVCTVQMYTQSTFNYCFIFDLLNGKLYGSYSGYADATTIANYCTGTVSDMVHAIKITDATTKLSAIKTMINQVNTIGHHVFFDVSALNTSDYLVTITYSVSSGRTYFKVLGLVNGTMIHKDYANSELAATTLVSTLNQAASLATTSDLSVASLASKFEGTAPIAMDVNQAGTKINAHFDLTGATTGQVPAVNANATGVSFVDNISKAIKYKNIQGVEQSGSLDFVLCTKAEYDALANPNPTTIYIIKPYTITPTLVNCTASAQNKTAMKTGETVTLVYTFDGTNYTCPTEAPVVTGATGAWTKDSNTQGTLVLTNPTANISFTITAVSAVQTWLLNSSINSISGQQAGDYVEFNVAFTSNGTNYTSMYFGSDMEYNYELYYGTSSTSLQTRACYGDGDPYSTWTNQAYRTIVISGAIPADLLTWLQSNGTLQ